MCTPFILPHMLLRLTVRCLSKLPTRIAETGNWQFSNNIRIKTLQIRFIMLRKCVGWATRAPIQLQLTVVADHEKLWLLHVFVAWLWLFSDLNYSVHVPCTSYILCLITEEGEKAKPLKSSWLWSMKHLCPGSVTWWARHGTAWNKDLETEIWPQTKRFWMKQTASNFPLEKVWRANCLLLRLSIRFWLYSRSIWAVV